MLLATNPKSINKHARMLNPPFFITFGSFFDVFYIFWERKRGKRLQIRMKSFGLVPSGFGDISGDTIVAKINKKR